jgi:hypothetical protein
MAPTAQYPFLAALLSPFEKRHQRTLGLVIAAIAATGQARSFAIATTIAQWLGIRLDSAINRFYRLLRNHRVDYVAFITHWARLLCRDPQRPLLIAVDWTEWHHELRMLLASVVVDKRGIPLFAQAFDRLIRRRSQNARENTFLRLLADGLRRAGLSAIILCDRGFRRASWLLLLQQLQLGFVVRLMDDVYVERDGLRFPLQDLLLHEGQVLDLGPIRLRSDGAVTVRVIGYWAPGAKQPWWLATSLGGPATVVLKLYDRRMTVEEQFRDTKGCRFGVRLFWTHFRDPDALARFVMLLAVALLIWTVAGAIAAFNNPSLRLPCRKKGPRQSYVTIGLRVVTAGHLWVRPTTNCVTLFLDRPALRLVAGRSVGGK